MAGHPLLGLLVCFVEEAPGGLPQVPQHVEEVDHDVHAHVAVVPLGVELLDLVVVAVDQDDPASPMAGSRRVASSKVCLTTSAVSCTMLAKEPVVASCRSWPGAPATWPPLSAARPPATAWTLARAPTPTLARASSSACVNPVESSPSSQATTSSKRSCDPPNPACGVSSADGQELDEAGYKRRLGRVYAAVTPGSCGRPVIQPLPAGRLHVLGWSGWWWSVASRAPRRWGSCGRAGARQPAPGGRR